MHGDASDSKCLWHDGSVVFVLELRRGERSQQERKGGPMSGVTNVATWETKGGGKVRFISREE